MVLKFIVLMYSMASISYPAAPYKYVGETVTIVPVLLPGTFAFDTFIVTPALPSGLVINSFTGIISGVPKVQSNATLYEIHATYLNIQIVSTFISLDIICRKPYTGCPPPVLPKPNLWFNGNTNIPTVQHTNAFRYSWLVSNRSRNN